MYVHEILCNYNMDAQLQQPINKAVSLGLSPFTLSLGL